MNGTGPVGFIDATRFPFVEVTIYPRIKPLKVEEVSLEPDEIIIGNEEWLSIEGGEKFWIEDSF